MTEITAIEITEIETIIEKEIKETAIIIEIEIIMKEIEVEKEEITHKICQINQEK